MTTPKNDADKLTALMDALAQRAEVAPAQEIIDDATAAGVDVRGVAAHVRTLLGDAVLRAKKQRLARAADAHAKNVAALGRRATRLPATAASRRALLGIVMQRAPEMRQSLVTLQHRDFEAFSDADVESALRQLDALGLLDEELGREE